MTRILIFIGIFLISLFEARAQDFLCRTGHVNIRSENSIKNIEADNYQIISFLNPSNGTISFEGLLKSFEFQLGAIDRVFASEKVNVKQYPKIKFEGKIKGIENIDLNNFGEYPVTVEGTLFIWDEKRKTKAKGTVTSIGDGSQIFAYSGFLMQIEKNSMVKIDQLLKDKLPSLGISTSSVGLSRDINVLLDASYKLR